MKYLLSYIFLAFALQIAAQNIPNPNFEAWTPSGNEPPFDWSEPTNWKSNNATVEFIGAAITPTDDAYEGEFAVSLTTTILFEEVVPGMLVNGNPSVDFPSYSVNVETGGTPLSDLTDETNSLPQFFSGYYKFSTTSLFDSAFVEVLLTKLNSETNQIDTTSYGHSLLAPADEYIEISIPINDLNTGIEPDNIIVAFYSTNPNNPQPSGHLIVDQLNFTFLPSDIVETSGLQDEITVFPNPVNTKLQMKTSTRGTNKTYEVSNLYGNILTRATSNKTTTTIDFEDLENGIYILRVFDENHQLIKTERIIKL